ncbi:MAG TPA: adenylate/guanylate cyclase domain-containing protein [Pyrinomonadaceae bacterium]|nr:adenylate/guanylate cyclase domain-containing protein [Pyrinomonadaceae bacterium]
MPFREFHYRWEFDLESSPEQLWPLVADTNRFNRDTGIPEIEAISGRGKGLSNARRRLRLFFLGMAVEWEEQPFEWVRPHRFGVVRRYTSGPMAELCMTAELIPGAPTANDNDRETATKLIYQVWAQPKNILGLIAIPVQIGIVSARNFARTFREYDELAKHGRTVASFSPEVEFVPGGRARLLALSEKLAAEGINSELVALLVDHVENADDFALARIRPYELAQQWQQPRRAVLETCLCATRAGILDLQWNLICPMCRGGAATDSLKEIASQVHCPGCNIDFTVNFEQSVELTFRLNPSIREADSENFCIGGPQVTPHIVAQQLLAARSARAIDLNLEAGRYRLRTMSLAGWQHLRAGDRGERAVRLRATSDGWPSEELLIAQDADVEFENATDDEQLFILERAAWSDEAATAAEVTALQVFRDLFASEALRPGEQISVGTLTVLFTDLKESTRMYREIGDATAFGRVMNHFDVLKQAIANEDGALVKTIGDAVMAVFRQPAAALRAMLHAQQSLASPPDGMLPLKLKAGLHIGPCIAVTLNDRLDYFGSTVNLAARLEGQSTGDDVVISTAVYSDPAVRELLSDPGNGFVATRFEMSLKGFEERFELWRVARASSASV